MGAMPRQPRLTRAGRWHVANGEPDERLVRENALWRAVMAEEPPRVLARKLLFLLEHILPGVPAEVLFGSGTGDYVEVIGTRGFPRSRGLGCRIPLGVGITGETARTARMAWVPDVSVDPHYIPAVQGAIWELAIPLLDHARVVGVIDLESADSERPSAAKRRYLRQLGLLAGPAFGRALRGAVVTLVPSAVRGSEPARLVAVRPRTDWGAVSDLLTAHRLESSFLPVVRLANRDLVGYEAEVRGPARSRWEEASLLRATAAYAGPAESAALDLASLQQALESWGDREGRLFIDINATSLSRPGFVTSFRTLLRRFRHAPDTLVLEIATAVPRMEQALHVLGNVPFAVDHYGAGGTTGHALVELRPTYIKLAESLVMGVDQDFGRRTYIESLQYYTRRTGIELIALGIGLPGELRALREVGVALGQGPVFDL